MRGITAFVVTVFLLVGAGALADAVLTERAEEESSAQLTSVLGAPAEVDLRGWPVVLRVLAGSVPEVGVVATDVPLADGSVTLDRLEATVFDVRVTLDDLTAPEAAEIEGGSGTFEAQLGEEAVGALTGQPGAVRLRDGLGQLDLGGRTVDVAASVEGGAVVLRPVGTVPAGVEPLTVTLPALPGQAVVDSVRIGSGVVLLSGRILQLVP